MVFTKYVLSRTGLFPKFEPDVSEVLRAARVVHEVKHLYNNRGVWCWYVCPKVWRLKPVVEIMRLFRANGVFLRPHYSRQYQEWVLAVPDRDQQFMMDVRAVRKDFSNFIDIEKRKKQEIKERRKKFDKLQNFLGRTR